MTTTAPVETNIGVFYEAIELNTIAPSKTNPRKHFDEAELNELAQSIKDKGVIQPIVIRPNTGGKPQWELVAGERRWRASKIAGAGSIPAIARNLDDRAVLEIQVIENLQRADVHPLDEANGYKQLMAEHEYTAEILAEKVGKSKEYIYARIKLAELIPQIQAKFYGNEITAGHAILLARLPESSQIDAAKAMYEARYDDVDNKRQKTLLSVRELASWIQRNIQMELSKAPFDPKDAQLLPAAGACIACPKRSGAQPELFPELGKRDHCTDRSCYDRKLNAFIKKAVSAKEMLPITTEHNQRTSGAIYQYSSDFKDTKNYGKCDSSRPAIKIDGHSKGEVIEICCSRSCKKHSGNTRTTRPASELAAEKARKRKALLERTFRSRVYAALSPNITAKPKMAGLPLVLISLAVFDRLEHSMRQAVIKELGILEKPNDYHRTALREYLGSLEADQLWHATVKMVACRELNVSEYSSDYASGCEDLLALAKHYGVDHKKIRIQVAATAKEPVQTSAKPAAKKKAK